MEVVLSAPQTAQHTPAARRTRLMTSTEALVNGVTRGVAGRGRRWLP